MMFLSRKKKCGNLLVSWVAYVKHSFSQLA